MWTAAFVLLRPLPLALVASLAGNVWQWRGAAVDSALVAADTAAAKELGMEVGKRQAAEERANRAADAANMAQADSLQLLSDLSALVERGKQRVTVYETRVQMLPPADCAPGADRMDALNGLLQ